METPEFQPASDEKKVRIWAMAIHLSQFAHVILPMAGIVAPIVIWQVQKDSMPELDEHGRNVANWLLSFVIYAIVSLLLCVVAIGIPMLLVLLALGIIYPIIGALKANDGIAWKYPGSIKFF